MKEIKAEQKKYMTMIGMLNKYVTPCPADKRTRSAFGEGCNEVIMVGSASCQMCSCFKGMDYEKGIVKCCLE